MSVEYTQNSLKAINEAKLYAKQREDAAAIAFVVLAENGQIDAVTAAEQSTLFAEWVPGVNYAVGNCSIISADKATGMTATPTTRGGSRTRPPPSGR